MAKYIRTYYNNEKSIIRMLGCHQCPLMRFDNGLFVCECRYYRSPMGNIVKDFVSVYHRESKRVLEYIEPPIWCKLPSTFDEMSKSKNTFTLTQIGIHVNPNDVDVNCRLIDTVEDNYDVNSITNYRSSFPSINPNDYSIGKRKDYRRESASLFSGYGSKALEINRTVFSQNRDNKRTGNGTYNSRVMDDYIINLTKPKDSKICSLCGEEDDSVDRNSNLGMCDECTEISEGDEMKLNQAFINNFRLKRNVKIESSVQFKRLKDINLEYDE